MINQDTQAQNAGFLAYLTLALLAASLWLFAPYLHFVLVAAVLALATSHVFNALVGAMGRSGVPDRVKRARRGLAAGLLTLFFLAMIFAPLLYFIAVTYDQAAGLDLAQVKATLLQVGEKAAAMVKKIPLLQGLLDRLLAEGTAAIEGPAIETAISAAKGLVSGAGALLGQVVWILLFYFLFNLYSAQILGFAAALMPMRAEDETYLYRECTGTVAVVFYGTLFNMAAQGLAFGVLMAVVGGYNAVYLGVLTGFCSVVPIVGAALVYVPVIVLELLAGGYLNAVMILGFAWVVMGFLIDNILRMVFIGYLKKKFGFEYTMNEILILLSILAGIATVGFWGLIIGPMVVALTLAAANLFSSRHGGKTGNAKHDNGPGQVAPPG